MSWQTLTRSAWVKLGCVLALILLIKAVFLSFDSEPSFFYGDSIAYLAIPILHWIPPDRSFLYGFLIGRAALQTHSLETLIYLQAFCSAIAAWLLCLALSGALRVRLLIASLFGILCAVEPLQLMMERYVMTEAVSNFLFAIYFFLILLYLRQGRLWLLLAAQAAGVVMIAIRISFVPELLVNSVLVPLLSPLAVSFYRTASAKLGGRSFKLDGTTALRVAAHVALCLVVSQGLLTGYKRWYGHLAHREPALFYGNGAFLLSDFAPLIDLQDFPKWSHGQAILARVRLNRKDLQLRPAQHFVPGGLWDAVRAEYPDEKEANKVATRAATRALLRQPLGAIRLAERTFLLYFDPENLKQLLLLDEGHGGQLDPGWPNLLRTRFGVGDPKGYDFTLTKRWHLYAMPWYWLILGTLTASPVFLFLASRKNITMLIVIVVSALLLLEGATLTVDRPTPRFLTTDAWLVLLLWGIAANALAQRMRRLPGTTGIKGELALPA